MLLITLQDHLFDYVDESYSVTIQMKIHHWAVLSFGGVYILYKVVLTFESVGEILKCNHSYKGYWALLSCCVVNSAVQGGSHFCDSGSNAKVWLIIQMKAGEQFFPVVLFIMLYKVVLTFESVDEILKCDHSNESYWAVLSCGAVCYAVQRGSNFWVCGKNP